MSHSQKSCHAGPSVTSSLGARTVHRGYKPTLGHVELAYTGDVVTVPLVIADRVTLHGLDRPTWAQEWDEPGDWLPSSWGVSPRSTLPRQ